MTLRFTEEGTSEVDSQRRKGRANVKYNWNEWRWSGAPRKGRGFGDEPGADVQAIEGKWR